jgi:hypothetical protein
VRRSGGRVPTLFLPRDNPTVMACVRAYATDPGWLRLIHPALVAGPGAGRLPRPEPAAKTTPARPR